MKKQINRLGLRSVELFILPLATWRVSTEMHSFSFYRATAPHSYKEKNARLNKLTQWKKVCKIAPSILPQWMYPGESASPTAKGLFFADSEHALDTQLDEICGERASVQTQKSPQIARGHVCQHQIHPVFFKLSERHFGMSRYRPLCK